MASRAVLPPPVNRRGVPLNWDLISIRRRDVDDRAARAEARRLRKWRRPPCAGPPVRLPLVSPPSGRAKSRAPRYLRRASTRIGQPGERIPPLTVPPLYAQYGLSDYCASGRQSSNSAAYSVMNRSTFCASRRNAVADNESNLLSIREGGKG